jgi:hypothetical protein
MTKADNLTFITKSFNMGQTTIDTSVLEALLAEGQEEENKTRENTQPFTGEETFEQGGYYPNPGFDNITGTLFDGVDRMETPILEEEKSNPIILSVVETDAYKNATSNGVRQRMIDNALNDANMDIYRTKGESTFVPTIRTQQFTDEEGNKETFIVPKPGAESSGFQRGVGGALMNIIQGVGSGVEKGFDIPFTDKRTPGTDDFLTDPETDYFDEEFPTYPSAGALEKAGQDVLPIIAGAMTGAGIVKSADEVVGMSPKLAKWISSKWDEAKKTDPANAKKKLENMLKAFFVERGANLGATIATPDDMEPLIGDDMLEFVGIDPETNQQLGHYIDNEAFTALGRAGISLLGAGWEAGKRFIPKLSKKPEKRAVEVGLMLIRQIDPGITDDLPGEILAERARILGETVMNNREFQLGLLGKKVVKNADGVETIVDVIPGGSIELDTGTSLALGAKEYVEKAYGWMKETMSPEEYARAIDKYTDEVVLNIVGLKQSRRGNTMIQQGEASINQDAMRVLDTAADQAVEGGKANADTAGRLLGQDTLQPVADALDASTSAAVNRELVEGTANLVQDRDAIIGMLGKAKENNALGTTSIENQTLNQLTGPDLFASWERSYKNYNDAFEALPNDIPVDMEDLKALIEDVSTKTNDFDFVTTATTKQDPFREMLQGLKRQVTGTDDAGKPIMETGEEVLARLDNIDLKWLYTNLRPEISRRLNALEAAGAPTSKPLIQLKEWIDGAAEASGQTEFRAAMDLYEEHAGTYLRTDELAQWESKARQVRSKEVAPGVRMGQENLFEMGRQAFSSAEQALTSGQMDAFLNALTKGSGETVPDTLTEAYVAMAIAGLGKTVAPGSKVTSAQVRDAVQPYIEQLSRVDPSNKAVQMFEDTVKNLEMVELGMVDAKALEASTRQIYQETLLEAQEKAASRFINNLSGKNPSVMSDPSEVFTTIFNAKNSPDLVQELLNQGRAAGNPLIVDGIKSKYISFIKESISTAKRIGPDSSTQGGGVTRELSPKQLDNMLESNFDNTLQTMKVIFRDEPAKAESMIHLLDVLNVAVNNRAIRGNNFGSSTVLDEKLKEKMNRLIVLTLGVLNPVATKARNISAALLDGRKKDIVEAIELQIDTILTSPQYFDEIMNAVAKDATPNTLLAAMERNGIRSAIALNKEIEPEDDLERIQSDMQ